jgi:predicted phosphate transport protein (TIGR00153 family)
MSTSKMLGWFEQRRRSKTLNLAQQHIILAVETVEELSRALTAFSKKEYAMVDSSINRLFSEEVQIDDLRRTIMEELSKGELPEKYREDLKGLVNHLDEMADMIKDSARNVEILQEVKVPAEVVDSYRKIGVTLVRSVRALQASIEALEKGRDEVISVSEEVDKCESEIDGEYLTTKVLILQNGRRFNAAETMAMRDLLEFLEQASDLIVRTANYVRILASEKSEVRE